MSVTYSATATYILTIGPASSTASPAGAIVPCKTVVGRISTVAALAQAALVAIVEGSQVLI